MGYGNHETFVFICTFWMSCMQYFLSLLNSKDCSVSMKCGCYFFQNAGVSTTSRVKISSRPSSIAIVQIQVWKSLRLS